MPPRMRLQGEQIAVFDFGAARFCRLDGGSGQRIDWREDELPEGGEVMSTTATIDEIRSWPVEQRLEIVFKLWDEILDSGWQPEMNESLRAELGRHGRDTKQTPRTCVPGRRSRPG